jgi:NAD(P)H-flavin reductase
MEFAKERFQYEAGQYVFVCIPKLSTLEWHPFSLSSSPHHSSVMIHARVLGNWTKRLSSLAYRCQQPDVQLPKVLPRLQHVCYATAGVSVVLDYAGGEKKD